MLESPSSSSASGRDKAEHAPSAHPALRLPPLFFARATQRTAPPRSARGRGNVCLAPFNIKIWAGRKTELAKRSSSERVGVDGNLLEPNLLHRSVCGVRLHLLHQVQHVVTADGFAKDCVLVVKVRSLPVREEELAPVGVGSAVGHRQYSPRVEPQTLHNLVPELPSVHALPPLPRARRIPALNHERFDVAVEHRSVVVV
mmetsp:Transcript_30985/g.100959  ORF Transcript_30985/g.100959 Transcript_30985/m.100959 type:complete len:200 (+) Transcript_30985:1670-2269(+)